MRAIRTIAFKTFIPVLPRNSNQIKVITHLTPPNRQLPVPLIGNDCSH